MNIPITILTCCSFVSNTTDIFTTPYSFSANTNNLLGVYEVKIELHSIILFECTHSENSAQNLHRIHYTDIFDTALFCKENIKSFLLSGLRTIRDVLAEEILNVKDNLMV
jgi:hypothetical protein